MPFAQELVIPVKELPVVNWTSPAGTEDDASSVAPPLTYPASVWAAASKPGAYEITLEV